MGKMTKQEALEELKSRLRCADYVDSDYVDSVSKEAIKIAIEALDREIPNLAGCTMCNDEDDGTPGAHDTFVLESFLRDIDRSLKSAVTAGRQSLCFHVDCDVDKSDYYKKIIFLCLYCVVE